MGAGIGPAAVDLRLRADAALAEIVVQCETVAGHERAAIAVGRATVRIRGDTGAPATFLSRATGGNGITGVIFETVGGRAGVDRLAGRTGRAAARNARDGTGPPIATVLRAGIVSLATQRRFGADRIDTKEGMSDVASAKIETLAVGVGGATGGAHWRAGRYVTIPAA